MKLVVGALILCVVCLATAVWKLAKQVVALRMEQVRMEQESKPPTATKDGLDLRPISASDVYDDLIKLRAELKGVRNRISLHESSHDMADSVTLNPTADHYQRIETPLLPLLVATEEFIPYLDGYKARIRVGNPHSLRINELKVVATWHASWNTNADAESNIALLDRTRKTTTANITKPFAPGAWTAIELTLAPATVDEIRNVSIAVTPGSIGMTVPSGVK